MASARASLSVCATIFGRTFHASRTREANCICSQCMRTISGWPDSMSGETGPRGNARAETASACLSVISSACRWPRDGAPSAVKIRS